MSRTGLYLAIVAIAVNGPRLILVFLEADGIPVAVPWRAGLLGVTGIATGVVLTGGGAYLAHALARGTDRRGLLAVAWLLVLTCAAVLVTPGLVAGLGEKALAAVLPSEGLRWLWSAVAVLAVELVAAGAMAAHTLLGAQQQQQLTAEELLAVAGERNRLRKQLEDLQQHQQPDTSQHQEQQLPSSGGSSGAAAAPGLSLKHGSSSSSSRRSTNQAASGASTSGRYPCRHGCGYIGTSLAAERGHQASCPNRDHGPRIAVAPGREHPS